MSDLTPQLQTSTDTYLRLLIAEAVNREITNALVPLRTMVQVQEGMVKQLNRDYSVIASNLGDLEELVRGNPKQNLLGLADQLKHVLQEAADIRTEVRQSINRVESAVTVRIEAMQKQLDTADDRREALINQMKGARYVLAGLAIVTGVAQYKEIAALLASLFS